MRTHGWGGDVPASDSEAVSRILAATREVIATKGADTGIVDVARALGVSRQTVYRYFAGTEELLVATARDASTGFLELIAEQMKGITDPATAVAEGIAFTIEALPKQPYVGLLLSPEHLSGLSVAVTSDDAIEFGRSMLLRFDVDWQAAGLGDDDLVELAEIMLRTLQSFVIDPGRPAREGAALRAFLLRWAVPGILRENRARPGTD